MQELDFKKNPLFRVISLFSGEYNSILSILAYSMTSGLLLLAIPIAVQSLVNTIARGGLQQQLIVLSGILLVVLALLAVLNLIQIYIAEKLRRRLAVRIALTLSHLIPKETFYNSINISDPKYINRFMEVFSVQKAAGTLLLDGSLIACQVIFGLILMAFYHPLLLIFSIILGLSLYFIIGILGKRGVKTAIKESTAKYEVLAWLEDIAEFPLIFKSKNADKYAIKKTDKLLIDYIDNREKHFKIVFSQQCATLFLQALISALLLALGGYLVIKNELSLGQLVAAELILGVILSGITKLIKYTHEYYSLVASVYKLDFLVESETEQSIKYDFKHQPGPASIEFKDVTIKHKANIVLTINDLRIEAGDKVIFCGKNNSGKGSFTNSLYGLNPAISGIIKIGDKRIQDMSLEHLRSEVQLIRGIEVIKGTIEENIRLGEEEVSTFELREIIARLKLDIEIDKLSNDLQTIIEPNLNQISKSAALKIMVARALIKKPRILILDEILDGFDPKEKQDIFNVLSLDKSFTLIATTHEKDLNLNADYELEVISGIISKVKR